MRRAVASKTQHSKLNILQALESFLYIHLVIKYLFETSNHSKYTLH
jgi:hypothetical protein